MHPTYLVKNGHSVGAILRDTRSSNLLLTRAEGLIQSAVRATCGQDLPVINYTNLPESNREYAIAIGTAGYMTQIFGLGNELATLGEEGFCLFPTSAANAVVTVITGRTERAVYHGVVHCTDFLLKEKGHDLFIPAVRAKRAPVMKVRGTYNLACWGRSPEYTADDWKKILDAMVEDSMNCVYFWLAGIFRSERFPETFSYGQTKLTTDGIHELIAHAHALGIEFYLGSGMFAWFGVDELAKTHPETAARVKGQAKGLCPSHPTSRQLMMDYLTEMYDAFPEADGMFLEIRDEYGQCECPLCSKPLKAAGGLQYGESEISFLRELSQAIWHKHPRAKFVCTIGYNEHKEDANFYRGVKSLSDPRYAWLVVRDNWELPWQQGRSKPLNHSAANMIHWKEYYRASLNDLRQWIGRAAQDQLLGCCPAFAPGFSSASFHSDEIPFPVDALPYAITRLAYRELCWTPQLDMDKLREILHEKFFGGDSPADLTTALLFLFDLIREHSTSRAFSPQQPWKRGAWREFLAQAGSPEVQSSPEAQERLRAYVRVATEVLPQLDRIEAILNCHPAEFRPKARRALPLLKKALEDVRQELCLTRSVFLPIGKPGSRL